MKKSVFFLGITSLSLSVAAIAVSALVPGLKTQKAFGSNPVEWSHYSAVEATFDDVGIKEYWVSCASHEHQFTAPTGDVHITDKGAPSRSFIDSLASNDDRLIAKYARGFNFDDGVNPYITIKNGFESLSIVDGEGVDGSKCLRASRSTAGDSYLRISKPYLDAVFADSNVKALSFAAKAHISTNNFRHIKVDAQYVNNNSDLTECFERNATNWGITTTYKTFFLTRGVYSQIDMSSGSLDYFVKFGNKDAIPQYLDLDDFRICTTDYFDYTQCGLETGYFSGSEVKDPAVNQKSFSIQSATNQGFDYDVRTEGVRSFRCEKVNGENAFYLGVGMRSLLQDGDYLTFDFRGTTALNNSNEGIRDGNRNNLACLGSSFPANKWVTLTIPKSGITNDGRFLIPGGSATGTYWIDNIRINKASYSFEDARYESLFGNYANVSHYGIADETASGTLRDTTKDYLVIGEWGGWSKPEFTTEKASNGSYSLKMKNTGYNKPVRAMPTWYDIMDEDSIMSFDIYTDDMEFAGDVFSGVVKGQWCTVNFHKSDFASNYRIFGGGSDSNRITRGGTMYLDNFVLVL